MIKHISFDFWDTLVIGDPEYRKKRKKYLSDRLGIDENIVSPAVKKVKAFCDGTSEKTMSSIQSETQIRFLVAELIGKEPDNALVFEICNKFSYLIWEHQPIRLFTRDFFQRLTEKHSVSIMCNAGIISGHTLCSILCRTPEFDFFGDEMYFSDVIGLFKPNPLILREILRGDYCNATVAEEVLHVGDNPNTDGKFCEYSGMQYLQVEKGNPNFEQIFELLK